MERVSGRRMRRFEGTCYIPGEQLAMMAKYYRGANLNLNLTLYEDDLDSMRQALDNNCWCAKLDDLDRMKLQHMKGVEWKALHDHCTMMNDSGSDKQLATIKTSQQAGCARRSVDRCTSFSNCSLLLNGNRNPRSSEVRPSRKVRYDLPRTTRNEYFASEYSPQSVGGDQDDIRCVVCTREVCAVCKNPLTGACRCRCPIPNAGLCAECDPEKQERPVTTPEANRAEDETILTSMLFNLMNSTLTNSAGPLCRCQPENFKQESTASSGTSCSCCDERVQKIFVYDCNSNRKSQKSHRNKCQCLKSTSDCQEPDQESNSSSGCDCCKCSKTSKKKSSNDPRQRGSDGNGKASKKQDDGQKRDGKSKHISLDPREDLQPGTSEEETGRSNIKTRNEMLKKKNARTSKQSEDDRRAPKTSKSSDDGFEKSYSSGNSRDHNRKSVNQRKPTQNHNSTGSHPQPRSSMKSTLDESERKDRSNYGLLDSQKSARSHHDPQNDRKPSPRAGGSSSEDKPEGGSHRTNPPSRTETEMVGEQDSEVDGNHSLDNVKDIFVCIPKIQNSLDQLLALMSKKDCSFNSKEYVHLPAACTERRDSPQLLEDTSPKRMAEEDLVKNDGDEAKLSSRLCDKQNKSEVLAASSSFDGDTLRSQESTSLLHGTEQRVVLEEVRMEKCGVEEGEPAPVLTCHQFKNQRTDKNQSVKDRTDTHITLGRGSPNNKNYSISSASEWFTPKSKPRLFTSTHPMSGNVENGHPPLADVHENDTFENIRENCQNGAIPWSTERQFKCFTTSHSKLAPVHSSGRHLQNVGQLDSRYNYGLYAGVNDSMMDEYQRLFIVDPYDESKTRSDERIKPIDFRTNVQLRQQDSRFPGCSQIPSPKRPRTDEPNSEHPSTGIFLSGESMIGHSHQLHEHQGTQPGSSESTDGTSIVRTLLFHPQSSVKLTHIPPVVEAESENASPLIRMKYVKAPQFVQTQVDTLPVGGPKLRDCTFGVARKQLLVLSQEKNPREKPPAHECDAAELSSMKKLTFELHSDEALLTMSSTQLREMDCKPTFSNDSNLQNIEPVPSADEQFHPQGSNSNATGSTQISDVPSDREIAQTSDPSSDLDVLPLLPLDTLERSKSSMLNLGGPNNGNVFAQRKSVMADEAIRAIVDSSRDDTTRSEEGVFLKSKLKIAQLKRAKDEIQTIMRNVNEVIARIDSGQTVYVENRSEKHRPDMDERQPSWCNLDSLKVKEIPLLRVKQSTTNRQTTQWSPRDEKMNELFRTVNRVIDEQMPSDYGHSSNTCAAPVQIRQPALGTTSGHVVLDSGSNSTVFTETLRRSLEKQKISPSISTALESGSYVHESRKIQLRKRPLKRRSWIHVRNNAARPSKR